MTFIMLQLAKKILVLLCPLLHMVLCVGKSAWNDENFKEMKQKTQDYINEEVNLGLINWAVNYNKRPKSGAAALNVEFEHIPPRMFYIDDTVADKAPTVAISRWDHYSPLWYKCTTGNQAKLAGLIDLYKNHEDWSTSRRFKCAIFANLRCLRDKELELNKNDRIFEHKTAFQRYKEAFQELINLHYKKKYISDLDLSMWVLYSTINVRNNVHERTLMEKCCLLETAEGVVKNVCKKYGLKTLEGENQ